MNDTEYDRTLVEEARRISPIDFISSICSGVPIKVMAGGKRISASKILRSEISSDGIWVSFNWYGECLGDNINLVQKMMPGTRFFDAIEIITGKRPIFGVKATSLEQTPKRKTIHMYQRQNVNLKIPKWSDSPDEGREWLRGRGISKQAIEIAEKNNALKYTPTGVAFIGYNQYHLMKYIAVRYFKDQIDPEDNSTFNKKDAYGSLKKYPFMLIPEDSEKPYNAFIVEGGTNALATLDYALDKNQNVFIMTTGGVAIREWMKNETVLNYLKASKRIFLIGENESDGERESAEIKQQRTDAIRVNIIKELNEILGEEKVRRQDVPKEFGDMADMRKHLVLTNPPERMKEELNTKINNLTSEKPVSKPYRVRTPKLM